MAKELTAERLREVLDYDPETGVFTWRGSARRGWNGRVAGRDDHGYVRMSIDHIPYYAHRLAWLHVHGEWPAKDLDHRDRNRKNNAIANLRPCEMSENLANAKRPTNNTSGHKGVYRHRGKWRAAIGVGGRSVHIGVYDTLDDALAARRAFAAAEYGEFAGGD